MHVVRLEQMWVMEMNQTTVNNLIEKYKGNIPGAVKQNDRLWIIVHPDGSEVALTDYNQEITGHTDGAVDFPNLGKYIHYSGNAYYVICEANRIGFTTIDGGSNG